MENSLQANIVKLNIGEGIWYATTMAYHHIANGLFYIWNEKKRDFDDHRAAESGTAEFCEQTAARWNELSKRRKA